MAKKIERTEIVEEVIKQKTYNCFQICNILKSSPINRKVIDMKFNGKELSQEDWVSLLKENNLI